MEERDPFQLEDKNGNPILCYKCSQNAMNGKAIVSCDYCSLHWHIDCIDPPMSSIPSASRKWMCPNHAYHVTVSITFYHYMLNFLCSLKYDNLKNQES